MSTTGTTTSTTAASTDWPSDAATFRTTDGVDLVYRDSGGSGAPLVMLPGLGQSQLAFEYQFDGLRNSRRVITLDFRGHGLSAKPAYGYRIARLAADVRDLLDHLGLDRVDALGWSMGASVWWSFIDLFGTARLRHLVVVDQPTVIAKQPWMTEVEQQRAGALWDFTEVQQVVLMQRDPNAGLPDVASLRWSYTGEIDEQILQSLVDGMCQASADEVGRLLFDHCVQDWRDVLARIDIPTLVIGSEGSHVSTASQVATSEAINGSVVHVFPAEVASSHFPFLQNPGAFNAVLKDFLT